MFPLATWALGCDFRWLLLKPILHHCCGVGGEQLHPSVCTVSVFVPWAVIVTNPGNSLPLRHSLLLQCHGMVSDEPSDKPLLQPWGWAADTSAVSKMQVLLHTHLEHEDPPASESPDVSPAQLGLGWEREGVPQSLLSP